VRSRAGLQWMAVGPLSHSLQLQLGELVDSWRSLADDVAERASRSATCPGATRDAGLARPSRQEPITAGDPVVPAVCNTRCNSVREVMPSLAKTL